MLTRYARLIRYPVVFKALTGLTIAQFEGVYEGFVPRFAAAERKRLSRPDRRRAIGGGHPFELSVREQLLLTVVWLRRYPINAVLGYLFGVDETTALRTVHRVLPVLEAAGLDSMRLPDPGKWKRPRLDGLLAATPELALLVDTFEQRVQRPRARAEADAYYSGKKQQHTLKVQVAVTEGGRIADVPPSCRGPTADLTVLKESGLPDRLPKGVGLLGDLAYVGLAELHPDKLGATPRRKPRGKPRPDEDIAYNTAFARRRVRVEHAIGRLRCFRALADTDRHHRQHHTERARAVAGLVNQCLPD